MVRIIAQNVKRRIQHNQFIIKTHTHTYDNGVTNHNSMASGNKSIYRRKIESEVILIKK